MDLFVETGESKAFLDRYPKFYPAFEGLLELSNKCFGRTVLMHNRAEDVCFELGHSCRQDYLELLFLAVHGYGNGATKLLRGLYERGVVLAYIVKYPEKAERFVKYTAIQEDKMLNAALKVVTQEQLDEIVGLEAVREIRDRREQFKSEFQVTICKTCKTKGPAPSWDIDLASMARDVGEPYDQIYLFSYLIPNLHVHATLASIVRESECRGRIRETRSKHVGHTVERNSNSHCCHPVAKRILQVGS